jgi:membrane-bound metal-dependent hydrolase YbcI (DUF457 family)
MDIFTHMMISYILVTILGLGTEGMTEPQLLFGVIMGIFPDFDVLTFPLWKKLPRLQHHGITHTISFNVVSPIVLSFIAFLIWGTNPILLIPVGIFTGIFHVISDFITSFGVPLFAPATWKPYALGVDHPVTPYLLFPVLALIIIFWQLRAQRFPYSTFLMFLGITGLFIVGHLMVKLGLRLHIRRKYRHLGDKVDADPTMWYRTWYLMVTKRFGETNVLEYIKIKLGDEKKRSMFFDVQGPPRKVEPPIDSTQKAVLHSYTTLHDTLKDFSKEWDIACTVEEKDGLWVIFWFSWWLRWEVKVKGVLATVKKDGSLTQSVEVRPRSQVKW